MKDNRLFNAPLSLEKANYLIQALALSPASQVVDLGCGHGAFLQQIAQQYPITGVGVDNNPELIQQADDEWLKRTSESSLTFICSDADEYMKEMSPIDVIVCMGAEYIFGGYANLLKLAQQKLKSAGRMLVGLVYWKQSPPPEYLSATGMEGDIPYFDLLTTVNLARENDFIPLEVHRSNHDEWDTFESSTARQRYLKAIQNENTVLHDKAWQWQKGYLKWGMDTMGFCFLILQKI